MGYGTRIKGDSGGYGKHATTKGGRTTGSERKPRQIAIKESKVSKLPSEAEKSTARAKQEAIEERDRERAERRRRVNKGIAKKASKKGEAKKTSRAERRRKVTKEGKRRWGRTEFGVKAERKVKKFAKKTYGKLKNKFGDIFG